MAGTHHVLAARVAHGDSDTATALDNEITREGVLVHHDRRARRGDDERSLDLGSGGRAAGVHHTRVAVATFARELQRSVSVAIESSAERDELAHTLGSFVHEHPHRVVVAQPHAGAEGIGLVLRLGIGGDIAEHSSDAALRPTGCGLGDGAFRDHTHPHAVRGGAHGSGETRDARARDEQIEFFAHACAPRLSMSRAFANEAAMSRRSSPTSGSGTSNVAASTTSA